MAGALVNLAAALSGRVVVNLNFTAGRADDGVGRGPGRAADRGHQPGLPREGQARAARGARRRSGSRISRGTIGKRDRLLALVLACLAPVRLLEKLAGRRPADSVDDTVAVIFSSGSTGEPKGVVLSHFNIDSNIEAIAQVFRVQPDDRVLDILPLFHSFGYLLLWLAGCRGMGLVCHPNPLEAGTVGGLVERYKATVLFGTPTFLQLYPRRCAPAQFGSLRLVIAGAEKLPEAVSRLRGHVRHPAAGGLRHDRVLAGGRRQHARLPRPPGSSSPARGAGSSASRCRASRSASSIPSTDEPLPANTEGMVLVKGPNVMQGYLGRDDLTAAAIRDGWYVTGDLGHGGRGRLPQDHRPALAVLEDRRRDGPARPRRGGTQRGDRQPTSQSSP